jgi:heme oxygenase (biliverdin-IX-beta and delta-forming)
MIMTKLKEATRDQHENLENTVDVMGEVFSLDNYKLLLTKFYRFYAAIEPKVAENDLGSAGFDFDARRKTPLLEKDLEALGILEKVKTEIPLWDGLPDVSSLSKAFGGIYVMEGATLGGQVITRHLNQDFGLTPENGAAFFSSYGPQVGMMWKSFKETLTDWAEQNGNEDQIIGAARETFDSFSNCFAASVENGISKSNNG